MLLRAVGDLAGLQVHDPEARRSRGALVPRRVVDCTWRREMSVRLRLVNSLVCLG